MKRSETSQSLLLNLHCNYNHMVKACHNIALTCHFFRDFKQYKNLSYPYILKGDLKSVGSEFMVRRPDIEVIMFYKILEVIVTDYFSRFKYLIYKTIPETFKFNHLVEVRYINEDECDIRNSLIYDNKIFLSDKEFRDAIKFKLYLFKSIEHSLRQFNILKLSACFTIINSKIELIWNILKNMKMIHKYAHLLEDQINYEGNILKKGNIIELIKIKNKKLNKTFAKINKCKIIKKDLTKEGIIEFLFQKNSKNISSCIKTKIIIRIYEFNDQCSLYILFYFLNIQNSFDLYNFTIKKNKELNIFKDMIENYNKTNKDITSNI